MLDGNEEDLSANSVLQFWGVQFSIESFHFGHSTTPETISTRPVKLVPALKMSTKADFEHSRALKFLSTKSALT